MRLANLDYIGYVVVHSYMVVNPCPFADFAIAISLRTVRPSKDNDENLKLTLPIFF